MFYRDNGELKTSYGADAQIFALTQERWAFIAFMVAAFAVVPLVADAYWLRAVLIPFLVLSLAAVGLNILVGYCGQISLGAGAFMGIGAYAAYNLHVRIPGMPLVLSLAGGGLAATLAGMVFGIPSLRVRGLYLAVATLAAQFFSDWAFLRLGWLSNDSSSGSVTVSGLEAFGVRLDTPQAIYVFCLAVVTVLGLAAKNLVRGAAGRQWMAIRDMDVAASVIGVNPVMAKLSAFAVSSFLIGSAGALWGFMHLGSWEPSAFSIDRSFQLLFMVIIGGLGSIAGGFMGAAFIVLVPLALNRLLPIAGDALGMPFSTAAASHAESMLFGALIVWFLIVEPHGLARLWSLARQRARLWPFAHGAGA